MQVQLLPGALKKWPVRLEAGFQALNLEMRVRFPHGSLIDIAMWWNWQTHDAQNVAPLKAWEFKSPLGYYLTRVGQRPAEFHKLRLPGATPGLATEI